MFWTLLLIIQAIGLIAIAINSKLMLIIYFVMLIALIIYPHISKYIKKKF